MLTAALASTWELTDDTEAGPIWTDTRDTEIGASIRAQGQWAEGECAFIRSVLRPGDSVIDVGANIGYISRFCSRLVDWHGRVVAIEPEPRNLELLNLNVECDHPAEVGASGEGGGGVRLLSPRGGGHRVLHRAA